MLKRVLCLITCAMLFLVAFSGCQKKEEVTFTYDPKDLGTNIANVLKGNGSFAYNDGFIYFHGGDGIIEYNMATGKTVCLKTAGDRRDTIYLSKDFIYTMQSNRLNDSTGKTYSMVAMTKDGKTSKKLFSWEQSFSSPCLDGMELYFNSDGNLYRKHMETHEEEYLISSVGEYYLDDNYLYALGTGINGEILYRSPREKIQFESIQLPFDPYTFLPWEGQILLTGIKNKSYFVALYKDGKVTTLPIDSYIYQVFDNCLIYIDEVDKDPFPALKTYDLTTGEIKMLSKNVNPSTSFCVLAGRYICFAIVDEAGYSQYTYYDWQTGEMIQMYPKPNT